MRPPVSASHNCARRYSDFLCGLPTTNPTGTRDLAEEPLTPADRLRLVHTYVTSTPTDGGLGVVPGSSNWDRVESVLVLHDHTFNESWIRAWTTRQLGFVKFDKIREQVRSIACGGVASRILTCYHSLGKLWRCTSISSLSTPSTSCSSPASAFSATSCQCPIRLGTPPSSSSGRSPS